MIVGIYEAGEDVGVGDRQAGSTGRVGAARRHTRDLVALDDQLAVDNLIWRNDLAFDDELGRVGPYGDVVAAEIGETATTTRITTNKQPETRARTILFKLVPFSRSCPGIAGSRYTYL